jgi:hypothetical protein
VHVGGDDRFDVLRDLGVEPGDRSLVDRHHPPGLLRRDGRDRLGWRQGEVG